MKCGASATFRRQSGCDDVTVSEETCKGCHYIRPEQPIEITVTGNKHFIAEKQMRERWMPPIAPGDLIYNQGDWKIFRQRDTMGEAEYRVFRNDVFFCQTPGETEATLVVRCVEFVQHYTID